MFSSFVTFGIPKFGFGRTAETGTPIKITPVQVHDSETASDKRGRRLKHLLKLNHVNFAILYHHWQFHNHTPHVRLVIDHILSLSLVILDTSHAILSLQPISTTYPNSY
jgi:sugar phosphate isomerase/epimerase